MIEELARGMNIYYRGHVIHEDIRSICYTIYGTRPHRIELAIATTSAEAMQWIDQQVARRRAVKEESHLAWPDLMAWGELPAPPAGSQANGR